MHRCVANEDPGGDMKFRRWRGAPQSYQLTRSMPVLDDPAATQAQLEAWRRSQQIRNLAEPTVGFLLLLFVFTLPAIGVSLLLGLETAVNALLVWHAAAIPLFAASVWVAYRPTTPPWVRLNTYDLPKQGRDLVAAALTASNEAKLATAQGNGLTEAEVEAAVMADLWRVAILCRDADRTEGDLRKDLYAAAGDTVTTLQRFARAAIESADLYAAAASEPETDLAAEAWLRLENAQDNPPATEVLAEILDGGREDEHAVDDAG